MIIFIVVFISTVFIILHFVELAIKRKYEIRNEETLNNIKKLDERERNKTQ